MFEIWFEGLVLKVHLQLAGDSQRLPASLVLPREASHAYSLAKKQNRKQRAGSDGGGEAVQDGHFGMVRWGS